MYKSGTLIKCANKMVAFTRSGVRNGPGNKNIAHGATRKPRPSGPTAPIKGADKGGV